MSKELTKYSGVSCNVTVTSRSRFPSPPPSHPWIYCDKDLKSFFTIVIQICCIIGNLFGREIDIDFIEWTTCVLLFPPIFREKSIKFKHAWTESFAFIIILKVSETKRKRETAKLVQQIRSMICALISIFPNTFHRRENRVNFS